MLYLCLAASRICSWRGPPHLSSPFSFGVFQVWLPIINKGLGVCHLSNTSWSASRAPLQVQGALEVFYYRLLRFANSFLVSHRLLELPAGHACTDCLGLPAGRPCRQELQLWHHSCTGCLVLGPERGLESGSQLQSLGHTPKSAPSMHKCCHLMG